MKKYILLPILAIMAASCEHPYIDDVSGQEEGANVVMRFNTYYNQDNFTRAAERLTDQCSRLSVAIFKSDGTKVKNIIQRAGDSNYGTIAVSLAEGTYKVVAVAHNSTEGNATISSLEKVTFANNKMTDTFSACKSFTVTQDVDVEEAIELNRVVAMIRLTVNGNIPEEVNRFKFYYTGGSSTLNPSTGYGCVQSKQTEYRYAYVDGEPVSVYELYTAPHEQNDVLKIVITAIGEDGTELNEWTMENVPITRNKITTWTGSLFKDDGSGGGTIGDGNFDITLDTQWDGTINYTW